MKRIVEVLLCFVVVPGCSSAFGQNITRQQIMSNVGPFETLTWTMNQRNAQDQCVANIYIKTPFPVGVTTTGMAYCWRLPV